MRIKGGIIMIKRNKQEIYRALGEYIFNNKDDF
nr:hypothetical protein CoNPh37_CDS0189 [Staphylococcus phage S-CoN_Ph37]